MSDYRSHPEYLLAIKGEREVRARYIEALLRQGLSDHLFAVEAQTIDFSQITATDLAALLLRFPPLLKPLLTVCNMGGRALKKDLGISVNTLRPVLNAERAARIATYLHAALPVQMDISAVVALDTYQWLDTEVRKVKGSWEKQILTALRSLGVDCRKRMFTVAGHEYELDIAYPSEGAIRLGIDVKMIGAAADRHKRGDEIVNKAVKFKAEYPRAIFVAVVQYPFPGGQADVSARILAGTQQVDGVLFASDTAESIQNTVDDLHVFYVDASSR